MKKLKRFSALFLLFAFTVSALTGCGKKEEQEVKKVTFVQLADNGAFTDMKDGFVARMAELGYDDSNILYDTKNAQGDATTLNSICQELMGSDVDLIVPIVTPATQAVVNANIESGAEKPVIFISVTNPVGAGVMTEMETPDKNATGTSNAVPVDEIFKLADELTPDIKTYGIVYCSSEVNAVLTVENAKKYLDGQNVAYIEKTVVNSSDVAQAAQALVGDVDAIYVPIDSTVQTAMDQLASIAKDAGIPVYGSSPVMVASGALATVSVSDKQIGAMSADMADKFFKGTALKDIPAVTLDTFTTVVNKTTAEAVGVDSSKYSGDSVITLE
ncbi:ABC transporter substrate-binding protein [Anaerolentibacter hominis]|uniref:ABC transporter substrate-binding protein n=1 Tax=Anaerolentibacter hominis TaxID=3079009 RepID=UPI0031B823F4